MSERNVAVAPTTDSADFPYVTTPAQRQRLDLIHHLLEFGHEILIVQGEAGSGKTRMLDIIVEEASPNWRISHHCGSDIRSPAQLLAALSASLGLISAESVPAQTLTRIRRELVARRAEGQVVILAIDDADELDSGSCALLYELTRNEPGNAALRVLLTGANDGQLTARFEDLSAEPVLLHVIDIAPLSAAAAAELFEYIAESMGSELRIANDEIDTLVDVSGGNPARLIRALYALVDVELAPPEEPTSVAAGRRYGRARTVIVLCLVGAVVGAILQQIGIRRTPAPAIIEMTLPIGGSPGSATSVVRPLAEDGVAAHSQPLEALQPEQVSPVVEPATTDGSAPDDAEPSAYSVVAADPGNEAVLPAPERAPTVATSADSVAVVSATAEEAPAAGDANTAPALLPADKSVAETVAVPPKSVTRAAPREQSSAPVPAPAPRAATAPKDAVSKDHVSSAPYTRDSVLAQAGQNYVIQLFGSRDEAAARRMVSERGIAGRATVLSTEHAGARWYVVVYGSYPNRELANHAIAKLPAALVALKPWPRSIASLKP